jgi:hypothetical protein
MKSILIILFLLFFKSLLSQALIPDAVKIKSAYELLVADTSNKKLQESFVTAFPSNTKSFLRVFQTKNFDQLYKESYNYLYLFEKCAATYQKMVLSKCVNIGKNLVWDADAVGQLQEISVELSVKYLNIFIEDYNSLKIKEQNSLINFYADIENFDDNSEYQKLIDKLNSVGQVEIVKKLEGAKAKRKKLIDH